MKVPWNYFYFLRDLGSQVRKEDGAMESTLLFLYVSTCRKGDSGTRSESLVWMSY